MDYLVFNSLKSCAAQEIHGLSQYQGNAEGAMKAFCKAIFTKPIKFTGAGRDETVASGAIYMFYIFSAPVYKGNLSRSYSYGTDFAKFIEKYGLGKVWESPARENEVFHPDHANQVFVFMPDKEALREWWKSASKPKTTL